MYTVQRDDTGYVNAVSFNNMTIPRDARNADWLRFLAWNAGQAVPLDIDSVVVPMRPVDIELLSARKRRLLIQVGQVWPLLTAAQQSALKPWCQSIYNLDEGEPWPEIPAILVAVWRKLGVPER